MAHILVIDDDQSIGESFISLFQDQHKVDYAYNGKKAFKIIEKNDIDLIFLDFRLRGYDGLEILKKIKAIDESIIVIFITGYGTVDTIIQSISLGAFDYIEKPLDIKKLRVITKRALETKKLKQYIQSYTSEQIETYSFKRLIGKSQVMQNVFKKIGNLVNNDITVLITGESGVGKELISKTLHYNSHRKNEPFIAVNCSGLNENLLDNELFGHEAQAFTGADTKMRGKFEAAGEGTILLDEIGDMPISIQAKLLRILQEKEFHRLGSVKPIKLKARIVVATNKNIPDLIQKELFREDLFYRINVTNISVPPLRERKEDIILLINDFIKKTAKKLNKNIQGITEEALAILESYNWPGNVRELENVITNSCIKLSRPYIDANDISKYLISSLSDIDIFDKFIAAFLTKYEKNENIYQILINNLEKKLIKRLLQKYDNNKTLLAKKLGLSRLTIHNKLKIYDINASVLNNMEKINK